MRSSQMICFSCRRQLVAAALSKARVPRLPQWRAKPLIRSASSATQAPEASSLNKPHTNTDIDFDIDIDIDISEPWAADDDARDAHDAGANQDQDYTSARFRRVQSTKRMKMGPSSKKSLKIFQEVVRRQVDEEAKAPTDAKARDLSPEAVEYYTDLAKLRPMMRDQKLEDCLEFFLTKLWNKSPFEGRNRLLKQRGAFLMGKVAIAKTADFDNKALPSISQITQYFYEMDSLGSTRWSDMMLRLIKAIITKSSVRTDYESDEAFATAKLQKEELIDDLIESWIVFHRHKLSADYNTLQTSEEAEFRLPDINVEQLQYFAWKHNIRGALSCIFPDWVGQMREIPAVAIATFVLLVDDNHATPSARQKAKPLLVPIGHVVSACPIKRTALTEMLEPHPTILMYVVEQWDSVRQRLHGVRSGTRAPEHGTDAGMLKSNAKRPRGPEAHGKDAEFTGFDNIQLRSPYEKNIVAKIKYAIGMSDVLTLEAIWREFWDANRLQKNFDRTRGYPKVFDNFIMAFTALHKPLRAIDAWNAMTSIGVKPTLETWSSMIEGCRKARNGAGIENVWKKLVASDLPLDGAVWCSRIMGLMEAGEPDAGIRALHEMFKMSQLPGGVPLSTQAVNAAVTGLLRLNAKSAANEVLLWASQRGVEPDVYTYNILLGPLVAEGRSAEIKSTLQLMSDSKIKPNAATYTVLLEGLIGTIRNLSSIEQRLRVEKLLADMEQDGVEANRENLGRMLHLVLSEGIQSDNHTDGAVGAIFKYMDRKGIEPTPHILTILIDHYFTQGPSAMKNIDVLLQTYSHSLVDRVFWERVIKGYALAGATDRAFAWFEKTYFTSFIITLDTLEILLRALVRDNKMSAAARVVDNVKQHRGASVGGLNNSAKFLAQRQRWERYWRHGFWGYAMDCGLLDRAEWKSMTAPEDGGKVSRSVRP